MSSGKTFYAAKNWLLPLDPSLGPLHISLQINFRHSQGFRMLVVAIMFL